MGTGINGNIILFVTTSKGDGTMILITDAHALGVEIPIAIIDILQDLIVVGIDAELMDL